MYKTTGTIEFFADLTLKDAEWKICSVTYDWLNNKANVEVLMSDDDWVMTHSRIYSFSCETNWTDSDAVNAISGLSQFANSTII